MDYTFLLGSIENILGKSHKRARDNHAFHCPFCNHRKPKLEINMHTTERIAPQILTMDTSVMATLSQLRMLWQHTHCAACAHSRNAKRSHVDPRVRPGPATNGTAAQGASGTVRISNS